MLLPPPPCPSLPPPTTTPQVLMQVEARGQAYNHAGSDTWALSQVGGLMGRA